MWRRAEKLTLEYFTAKVDTSDTWARNDRYISFSFVVELKKNVEMLFIAEVKICSQIKCKYRYA